MNYASASGHGIKEPLHTTKSAPQGAGELNLKEIKLKWSSQNNSTQQCLNSGN